ncbi:MAG: FtsW/RodA/SpoVE family cell cycle protein [Lachnospiraceae bacterium]|nr:FtsW/RodA/SpoVE family cell cycle protein [Lachnospiraceae bacterium]
MEEYIKVLTEQIRCKQARDAVAEEVRGHMEDVLTALKNQGIAEEEAQKQMLLEMGDPVEAGIALDRVHRPKMAWHMLMLIGVLSLLGLGVQYIISVQCPNESFFSLSRQFLYLLIGFGLMAGMYCLDYSFFGVYGKLLGGVFLGVMMLEVFFFGRMVNGAMIFTGGNVSISLPMMMLLYVPMYAGILYSCRNEGRKGIAISVFFMLVPVWLTMAMPCLSMAVVLFLTLLVMLSFSMAKGWFGKNYKKALYVLWAGVLLAPPVVLFLGIKLSVFANYQIERIKVFINRSDENGAGYVYAQIHRLIENSQFLGGSSKIDTSTVLPNVNTDFIITHLISYYGILSGVLVLAILLFLVFQIFHITIRQRNQLGMMMGVGCGSLLGMMILLYFLENIGAIPYSYVYLPFFTSGGSGTVVTFLLLGIILSVYKYQDIPLRVEKKKWRIHVEQLR